MVENYGTAAWTLDEIQALRQEVQECRTVDHELALDLLLSTGLRISEAWDLHRGDLRHDGTVVVRSGKGGVDRLAYFIDGGGDSWTRARLLRYMDELGRTRASDPWHTVGKWAFRGALHRAGKRAGIQRLWRDRGDRPTRYVRPHAARHTWVRLARQAGYAWETIALLGWGSQRRLETIMEHYRTVDLPQVLEDAKGRHLNLPGAEA